MTAGMLLLAPGYTVNENTVQGVGIDLSGHCTATVSAVILHLAVGVSDVMVKVVMSGRSIKYIHELTLFCLQW